MTITNKNNKQMKTTPTAAQTAQKTVAVNPVIGSKLTSKTPITVNYRQGKSNTVECYEVECIDTNATGRRLTLIFRDEKGAEIMKRKVYKEHFEKMETQFFNASVATPSPAKTLAKTVASKNAGKNTSSVAAATKLTPQTWTAPKKPKPTETDEVSA